MARFARIAVEDDDIQQASSCQWCSSKGDKYVDIEEIDPCMLRELIKEIYAEAPGKFGGKRGQKIHIQHDGIGVIPLEELAKKERA